MIVPHVLIIEGNTAEVRQRQIAALGYDSGTGYARTLQKIEPSVRYDIVYPTDAEPKLPAGMSLDSYQGVAITGSALNIYDGGAAIERQIALVQAVFAAGIPTFGSCWGLQLAATAAGGLVRRNARGREFGFGRRIALTQAGQAHPMYAGKPNVFEAPTVHIDEVVTPPAGAIVLAQNDMGLQAVTFTHQRSTFWGVQYHPEYGYRDIAAIGDRYGSRLVDDGLFADTSDLGQFTRELRELDANPAHTPLLWKYGIGPSISDPDLRLTELRNWLRHQVIR
jgi:GMP synthase (glutamine-hydrolysing)